MVESKMRFFARERRVSAPGFPIWEDINARRKNRSFTFFDKRAPPDDEAGYLGQVRLQIYCRDYINPPTIGGRKALFEIRP